MLLSLWGGASVEHAQSASARLVWLTKRIIFPDFSSEVLKHCVDELQSQLILEEFTSGNIWMLFFNTVGFQQVGQNE